MDDAFARCRRVAAGILPVLALGLFGMVGCGRSQAPVEASLLKPDPVPPFSAGSDGLAELGESAWEATGEGAPNPNLKPDGPIEVQLNALARRIESGSLVYAPPVEPDGRIGRARIGWGRLMEALTLAAEQDARRGDLDALVLRTDTAVRFAALLMNGDALDVVTAAAGLRRLTETLGHHIRGMNEIQLQRVISAVEKSLAEVPPAQVPLTREAARIRAELEAARRDCADGGATCLSSRYGTQMISIETLITRNPEKRREFWLTVEQRLAGIEATALERADSPAVVDGASMLNLTDRRSELWKRERGGSAELVRRVSYGFEACLTEHRDAVGRLRLLGIETTALKQKLSAGAYPRSLDAFPAALQTDPHTFQPFHYSAGEDSMRVWGTGPDGRNDLGPRADGSTPDDLAIPRPPGR